MASTVVSPLANLNYMPNLYGWPNNVLVVPLPRVGGGSAIIEISGKEIKMSFCSAKCILTTVKSRDTFYVLSYNLKYDIHIKKLTVVSDCVITQGHI